METTENLFTDQPTSSLSPSDPLDSFDSKQLRVVVNADTHIPTETERKLASVANAVGIVLGIVLVVPAVYFTIKWMFDTDRALNSTKETQKGKARKAKTKAKVKKVKKALEGKEMDVEALAEALDLEPSKLS